MGCGSPEPFTRPVGSKQSRSSQRSHEGRDRCRDLLPKCGYFITKAWYFVLPDTGKHEFRVERIGRKDQTAYIDGDVAASNQDPLFVSSYNYSGPGSSHIELRRNRFCKPEWALFVNG